MEKTDKVLDYSDNNELAKNRNSKKTNLPSEDEIVEKFGYKAIN